MEKNTAQNIQDGFLNTARREKIAVVINLLTGSSLTGKIKSFDKFSVIIDSSGQDYLIFKHAISTISLDRKKPD
jgi:host factor-I protein